MTKVMTSSPACELSVEREANWERVYSDRSGMYPRILKTEEELKSDFFIQIWSTK